MEEGLGGKTAGNVTSGIGAEMNEDSDNEDMESETVAKRNGAKRQLSPQEMVGKTDF